MFKPFESGPDPECTVPQIGGEGDFSSQGILAGMTRARMRDLALTEAESLAEGCPQAVTLLGNIAKEMASYRLGDKPRIFCLDAWSKQELTLIDQVLGDGEVSIVVGGPGEAQVQESVMTGLWRVRRTHADGSIKSDHIEIAEVPSVVLDAVAETGVSQINIREAPAGAMNVMPVLAEINERVRQIQSDRDNHVISFTLLPMSPEDMLHLQRSLGPGRVHILSRGYGTCRIEQTGTKGVWSVQYLNAMDTVVLDTLEIGGVPMAARAGQEDFEDSAERLAEILEAYL